MRNSIRRGGVLLLIFLSIGIAIWISKSVWLTWAGRFLIMNGKPQKSDLIIVLTGDDEGDRARYAYHLFQNRYAPKILISGSTNLHSETGIHLMERYLIQLGVPQRDILIEKDSESTVENAHYSRRLVEEKGFRSVIVVTSAPHTLRASMIFRKVFSPRVKVTICCDPKTFQIKEWWKDPRSRRIVLREYFQIGWYLIYGD